MPHAQTNVNNFPILTVISPPVAAINQWFTALD